jgi:hypothetical protein
MAAQNRDQERLYPPGKLSFHFAVWSTLLLVVLVWMFWQDHDRPWKDYQKSFRAQQIKLAEKQEQVYAASTAEQLQKVRESGVGADSRVMASEDLERLLDAERAAQEKLARIHEVHDGKEGRADLAALEAELAKKKQAHYDAEFAEKEVKGLHAPARYEYEDAVRRFEHGHGSAGEVAERRETLNRWSTAVDRAEEKTRAATGELVAAQAKVDELRRPFVEEAKKATLALADYRATQGAAAGLKQRYARNTWRNWAVIDFLARSIEIKQVVLKHIHDNWNFASNVKVDRCMTCHMGVNDPSISDEVIADAFADVIEASYGKHGDDALEKFKADHGFERWMQPHSGLDLIMGPSSPHQMENVGCTVCHHGVGWSTDFSRAAHTPRNAEQKSGWQDAHDWKPPEFVDYPMVLKEYVQGMCFKCHRQGFGWPAPYEESLTHGWAQQWHDVPGKGFVAISPWDSFGEHRLPVAPGAVDGPRREVVRVRKAVEEARFAELDAALPEVVQRLGLVGEVPEIKQKREALEKAQKDARAAQGYSWDAESYDRGEESIVRYGCQGCHKMADFGPQVGYEQPPRVGPPLSYVADKVRPDWLAKWLIAPDSYRRDTRMPSFFWFAPKDRDWRYVGADGKPTADGAPHLVPVIDSHLFDGDEHIRDIGRQSQPIDLARMHVQVRAMQSYLLSLGGKHSRALPDDPEFLEAYAKDPLPGDVEKGREAVESYGCVACHVVPEVKGPDGGWVADDGARFLGEPAKGPRITSLGSKLKDARWLDAWLARPKHYSSTTTMGNMRWRDEVAPDGTVLRSAAQVRADVVAYLLAQKDPLFDALPGVAWDPEWRQDILPDMWAEYFGRDMVGNLRSQAEVEGEFKGMDEALMLAKLGEKLMARNGCFGCHEVKGHELDQPIGTELSNHGAKDLHQLEFGFVHAVPHSRAGFYRTKITHPRIWDAGRTKRWTDQLKMPRFNFRMDDGQKDLVSTRAAVAGIILGQVNTASEPIKPEAWYHPDASRRDIIAFRRVVERYGCNNCHPLEGQMSTIWRYLGAPSEAMPGEDPTAWPAATPFDLKFVVPALFAQGERTKTGWLHNFLQHPTNLRPMVRQRMPEFELNDQEADALVAGFQRLAGIKIRNRYDPESSLAGREYAEAVEIQVRDGSGAVTATRSVRDAASEAEFLFDTINCNKCHLPKGSPGADPNDGGVAPPLQLAARRLSKAWVMALLNEPTHLIRGTAMISPWQRSGYGRVIDPAYAPFQFQLRDDAAWQALWKASDQGKKPGPERDEATRRLVEVQREALADYVLHHYSWPRKPQPEPR